MARTKTNPDSFFQDIKKGIEESKEKAEKNAKNKKQNTVKNTIEKHEENTIENNIKKSVKNNVEDTVEITIEKPVVNFNLKVKDTKKSKNFYLKESTIKNITKYAKKYKMKESEFVETILNQFFEAHK